MDLPTPIPLKLLVRLLRALEAQYPNRELPENGPSLAEVINQISVLVGIYESLPMAETNVKPDPDKPTDTVTAEGV